MVHPTLSQLEEYTELAINKSKKDFTQILKEFVKTHGDFFAIKDEDFAEILFLQCKNILLSEELGMDAQYNAMRLCKFAMGSGRFIVLHKEDIWDFLVSNFYHDDGHVRNEAVNVFSRFWFSLNCSMTSPRIRGYIGKHKDLLNGAEKFMIRCFEHIYFLLREFTEKEFVIDRSIGESVHSVMLDFHPDDLKKGDRYFVTLRRAMEEMFRGHLGEIMGKHKSNLEFVYKQLRDPWLYLGCDDEEEIDSPVIAPRVYCLNVQMKYKHDPYPWKNLEVLPDMSLSDLAGTILNVFNFENDHCYGFYSNLEDSFAGSQEKYEVFADIGEETDADSVENTLLSQVFTEVGKKMLFLFDYGDNWKFIVTLCDVVEAAKPSRYPRLNGESGKVPKQYDLSF